MLFRSIYSVPFISQIGMEDLTILADKKRPIVVLEEHSLRGGLASALLEKAALSSLDLKIAPLSSKQSKLAEIGDQNFLREANGLGVQDIVNHFVSS